MKKCCVVPFMLFAICLAGCSKTPTTVEKFEETMKAAGYTILEAKNKFDPRLVKAITVARKDNGQVEFFVLTSEENAAASFALNKTKLEAMSGGNVTTSVTASNHSFYSLTTDDRYYLTSRVGDTLIYLNVPKEQKKAVAELVESLGY